MVRKKLILATILTISSFCCQAQAVQIPVSWDGGGDGHTWGDPYNWDPNVVPDNNTFDVTINAGTGLVEVGLEHNYTIIRLYCYGNVELETKDGSWAELICEGVPGLENYGYLEIELLTIEGNVLNTADAVLELETDGAEIVGNLSNLAGGLVKIERAEIKDGDIENAGQFNIRHHGYMYFENKFHNTSQIQLNGGAILYWAEEKGPGILDNDNTGLIKGFGVLHAAQLLNKGAIYAYGGSLVISSEGSLTNTGILGSKSMSSLHIKPGGDVNNQGTIEVNTGGGVVFDCNLVNETNGAIELRGGTLAATTITQTANANFVGFGGISGDVVIESDGLIKLTGPTNIVGDVEINPNATLEISDGTTLITGQTTCNGTIHIKGGRIIPQGGLSGDCNIIWEPGTYSNIADFNLDGKVNFKDFAGFADTWLWKASWYAP